MGVKVEGHHLHNHWDIAWIGEGEEFRLKGWSQGRVDFITFVTIQVYDYEYLTQFGGGTHVPTSVSITKVGAN